MREQIKKVSVRFGIDERLLAKICSVTGTTTMSLREIVSAYLAGEIFLTQINEAQGRKPLKGPLPKEGKVKVVARFSLEDFEYVSSLAKKLGFPLGPVLNKLLRESLRIVEDIRDHPSLVAKAELRSHKLGML